MFFWQISLCRKSGDNLRRRQTNPGIPKDSGVRLTPPPEIQSNRESLLEWQDHGDAIGVGRGARQVAQLLLGNRQLGKRFGIVHLQ